MREEKDEVEAAINKLAEEAAGQDPADFPSDRLHLRYITALCSVPSTLLSGRPLLVDFLCISGIFAMQMTWA